MNPHERLRDIKRMLPGTYGSYQLALKSERAHIQNTLKWVAEQIDAWEEATDEYTSDGVKIYSVQELKERINSEEAAS